MSVKEYVHAYYKLNSSTYKQIARPFGIYDSKAITSFFKPLSANPQSVVTFEEACHE